MKKQIKFLSSIFIITILISSCSVFRSNITKQKDEIMNTKRFSFKTTYSNNSKDEPVYNQSVHFLKEIDRYDKEVYTLYDVITIPYESFDLSDKMYIIVDKDIFPLENTSKEKIIGQDINESKSNILKADSTKATVVTGYDVVNKKAIKMVHSLDINIIDKIENASKVFLRYYIGPEMITSEIKGYELRTLKKLIKSR